MAGQDEKGRILAPATEVDRSARLLELLEEQKQQFEQLRLQFEGMMSGPAPSLRLTELAAEWLPRKLRSLASGESFEGRVRKHLLPALGWHTSATLRPKHVEQMMADLRGSGLSEQTVNHVRNVGLQLVDDAIRNGEWRTANPFSVVDPLRVPFTEGDVFTRQEAARFLAAVPQRWRALFAVAIYLGPRRGELFALRKAWVDLGANLIDFNGSHERNVTKTGGKRPNIPIPTELRPWIVSAMREAGTSIYLFPAANGEQLTRDTKLVDVVAFALEAAKLDEKRLTFHGLRRVSSCLHQEAGCHPWVVSKVLGHSQASLMMMGNPTENMTAKRYTRFSLDFIRVELNKLSLLNP